MRAFQTLVITVALFLGSALVAAPQAEENLAADAVCTPAPAPESAEAAALEQTLGLSDASSEAILRGYWHCTAYAEGHGHSWGYDYMDVHYNHAYYGAMNACERATHHHCHDVHCHYDHR